MEENKMWGEGRGGQSGEIERKKKSPVVDEKNKNKNNDENEKMGDPSFDASNPAPFSSSPFSSLLPSLPLFNSPHPSFPGHGVAKRIMGNEMAYLRLPRGEIERERERMGEWEREKTKRMEGVKECETEGKETPSISFSVCPAKQSALSKFPHSTLHLYHKKV